MILATVNADAGMVAKLDEEREELNIVAHRGLSAAALNEIKTRRLDSGEGYAQEAILKGLPIRAVGIGKDPGFEGLSSESRWISGSLCAPPARTESSNRSPAIIVERQP